MAWCWARNKQRSKWAPCLIDCDLLAKVYINLLDQKEPTLQFSNHKENQPQLSEKIQYFKKVVYPTKIENEEHKRGYSTNVRIKYLVKHYLICI